MSTLPTMSIKQKKSYGITPGSLNTKQLCEVDPKMSKKEKVSKKIAEFEKASVKMIAHLDLTCDVPSTKLSKNLEDAKKA